MSQTISYREFVDKNSTPVGTNKKEILEATSRNLEEKFSQIQHTEISRRQKFI